MSDTTPSDASVVFGAFDGNRPLPTATPADAAASPPVGTNLGGALPMEQPPAPILLPPPVPSPPRLYVVPCPASIPPSAPPTPGGRDLIALGRILLNANTLRRLRHGRMLSQQDMADDCWRRNFRVSIATIKRAESGHAVRFRIARELARYFDVPVTDLVVQ